MDNVTTLVPEQGTPEWHAIRIGKATASRVKDITAKTKTGYSTSRENYKSELLVERLTGKPTLIRETDSIRHGKQQEPFARGRYEFEAESLVEKVFFIHHKSILMAGASPDGLVGDDGLVEIKCPNTSTHVATLLGDTIDGGYIKQMQWQMACTGRSWCDFVSYDPRLPENMQYFCKRIERDEKLISELESEVAKFLAELDAMERALLDKFGEAQKAAA